MLEFFVALMRNVGLLALVALLYGVSIARLPKAAWPAALGLLCGFGAAVAILDPTRLAGYPADMRTPLIMMASFLGGPVSALISATIGVLVVISQGGANIFVFSTILVMSAVGGLVGHVLVIRNNGKIEAKHVLLVILFSPIVSLAVLTLPTSQAIVDAIRQHFLPANGMRILGLLLLGLMLLHETWRVDAANRVRTLAYTDDLSGLNNRRAFYACLDRAWERWQTEEKPFCIVMIDIDFFKRINDAHGHPIGDEVIRRLGTIMTSEMRQSDVAARLGGEEFAVLLREARGPFGVTFAERLRRRIEAEKVCAADSKLQFTVSVGVSRDIARCSSRQQMLSSADSALYVAKQGGRNRVVLDIETQSA